MADDRLPCGRPESMDATRSDSVACRLTAISFSPRQNASSRLTLVLWPAMTIERLMTGDFIVHLPFRSGAGRDFYALCRWQPVLRFVLALTGRKPAGFAPLPVRIGGVWPAFARCAD